ncbi:MAG: hypothetical protein K0S01_3967 [Herbinix sp.]|nr:hypothetical protein [Herbinix sp.]
MANAEIQWDFDRNLKRYRFEPFCYGPKSSALSEEEGMEWVVYFCGGIDRKFNSARARTEIINIFRR